MVKAAAELTVPTIYIDNRPHAMPPGERNLLEVCLSLGFNLPYFCWHPAMHSVGACRQCAVKVFKDAADTKGRIVMSCMTPAKDGMRISVADPEAAAFRAHVVEWLMVNHPHDCPICDEGGECHLQDMTVMAGQVYRRCRFPKRTHRDQDLGPFVNMEMNRCIQCYRCVRFYRDWAGGRDFGVMGWHDHVFFGRHEGGPLQSEFSGNLVEVCPTGVFTDKTQKRHYTRKWDLQTAPSVCAHCGLGCNVIPGERYGSVRRVRARFNGAVNGYFLCDRGRYGYEFTAGDRRIRTALLRDESGKLRPAAKAAVLDQLAKTLAGGKVMGIGSARASLESNFALRALVGRERFFAGVSRRQAELQKAILQVLRDGPCRTPSLREVESADAVFVLGEDLTNTAPMLDLAIRQAVLQRPREEIARKLGIPHWDDGPTRLAIQDERGPLFVATPNRTKLDGIAAATFRAAPDDLSRLGFAVAHEIDPASADVPGLSESMRELAARIARELQSARRPLVVSGPNCGEISLVRAAADVARALKRKDHPADLCFTAPECNTIGLALMDAGCIEDSLACSRTSPTDTIIILETDLYRHVSSETADSILSSAKNVIVIDHMTNPTVNRAHVVLPAAAFGEADGTFVNNEGRAQRFYKAFVPAEPVQDSWRWLGELSAARDRCHVRHRRDSQGRTSPSCGEACPVRPSGHASASGSMAPDIGALQAEMAGAFPAFQDVPKIAPPAGFRMVGQRIPRQSHRYSGRTAVTANLDVHEPKPPDDADSPLSFSMEGSPLQPPPELLSNYWSPGWNSVQAINRFQIEVGGALHGGDPGRRLIEPRTESTVGDSATGMAEYFGDVPTAFAPQAGKWWAVPAHHIFGSEELSMHSPAIRQLAPRPYVAINSEEARRLGIQDGQEISLAIGGRSWRLAVQASPSLPAGLAAVPAGLPELAGLELPAWAEVRPD